MNGVIGIFQADLPIAPALELQRACGILSHRGPFEMFLGPGIGLAAERVETRDGITLAFSGWVDGNLSDIWDRYRKVGIGFAETLAGEFSLALWDADARKLFAVRDPLGTQPFHFAELRGRWSFAPEIKAIASAGRPRFSAVAEYLAPGFSPDRGREETCWEGIDSIPPSHCLTVDAGGSRLTQYWDFDGARVTIPQTPGECVEQFRWLFTQAVRRRTREPFAVAVSGGLDSSSIFCLSAREGTAPGFGVSCVGSAPQYDERSFLEALERKVPLPIRRFSISELPSAETLWAGFATQVRRVEAPLVDSLWPLFDDLCEAAHRGGAKTLLTGHWGDQTLFCPEYLIDALFTGRWHRLVDLARFRRYFGWEGSRTLSLAMARGALKSALPRPWFRRLRDWKRSRRPDPRLAPFLPSFEMERFHYAPDPNPSHLPTHYGRALYGEVRSRFSVWCLEWNEKIAAAHGIRISHPFLDRDLLEFLMAIPGHWANFRGQPRFLLRQSMKSILPSEIQSRRGKGDFTALAHRTALGISRSTAERLTDASELVRRGWVSPGSLGPLVRQLQGNLTGSDARPTWRLLDLLALELWLGTLEGTAP